MDQKKGWKGTFALAQQCWKSEANEFNSASTFRKFQRTKEMLNGCWSKVYWPLNSFNNDSTSFQHVSTMWKGRGKCFQHCHSTKSKGCWSKCWITLRIFSQGEIPIYFVDFFRVSLCGIGEEHFISPSLAPAKSLVFLDQLKVSWFFSYRNKIRRRISNTIFGGF